MANTVSKENEGVEMNEESITEKNIFYFLIISLLIIQKW